MNKSKIKKFIGKKFLVYAEKVYEAEIDAEGNLVCEPESEEIKNIVCLDDDSKKFTEKDFSNISW